jgi:hypothetical protein
VTDEVLISEVYILIIDTDHFAGRFSDYLCAYTTGFYGEEAAHDSIIMSVSDLFYRDHGIEDDDAEKVSRHDGLLAEEKNIFYGYVVDNITEDGSYSPVVVWPSRKYGVSAAGEYGELKEDNYDEYNFPAGYSVGIYFSEKPSEQMIDLVKIRAKKFFDEIYPKMGSGSNPRVLVEGFRLITHRKLAAEVSI